MTTIKGELLVFKLTVQSSYIKNSEDPASELSFDTIQWWLMKDETWRIKTYAKDSDIHIHRIGSKIEFKTAADNTENHYGDVIESAFFIKLENINDQEKLESAMKEFGGINALEISKDKKFAFWNPTQTKFSSKSQPK